jgi:hypothetical protein
MAWYFRVIELADGRWACCHGRQQFDTHDELRHAVEHLRIVAHASRPAELSLHRLDGSVEQIGAV